MKKRLLLKLGLVALLGAGLFVAWLWWTEPRTGICRYTANRIRAGMSQVDVNSLIGQYPQGTFRRFPGESKGLKGRVWWTNGENEYFPVIRVEFDERMLVVRCRYYPIPDSWEDKMYRWLHLD